MQLVWVRNRHDALQPLLHPRYTEGKHLIYAGISWRMECAYCYLHYLQACGMHFYYAAAPSQVVLGQTIELTCRGECLHSTHKLQHLPRYSGHVN
jgi:hypothetical protein